MIPNNSLIVSSTEPTGKNRKKVWMQKGKNFFMASDASFKDINDNTYLEYIQSTNEHHTTKASWHRYLASDLKLNKSYTISFDVKSTTNNNLMSKFFRIDKVSDGNILKSFDTSILISTEYKRYSLTFIATETSLNLTVRNADGIDAYIRNIQLEQNPTATEHEDYIEPKIYIKNSNDVYEKFM